VRADISALIKFVALNYLAVVKAIKKRNRHFKSVFGQQQWQQQKHAHGQHADGQQQPKQQQQQQQEGFNPLHPLDLLSQEVFFTSNRLARLATRAELLSRQAECDLSTSGGAGLAAAAATACAAKVAPADSHAGACGSHASSIDADCGMSAACCSPTGQAAARESLLEEYQCPVCLELLRNPVVLTCAHRFCWGCLVAHFAAIRGPRAAGGSAAAAAAAARLALQQHAADGEGDWHMQEPPSQQQHAHEQRPAPSAESSGAGAGGQAEDEALVVLEKIVEAQDCEDSAYYSCPVCRQPQVLNIESLQVDLLLTKYVDSLRVQLRVRDPSAPATPATTTPAAAAAAVAAAAAAAADQHVRAAAAAGQSDMGEEEDTPMADSQADAAAHACMQQQQQHARVSQVLLTIAEESDDMHVEVEGSEEEELMQEPPGGWLLPPQLPKHEVRLCAAVGLVRLHLFKTKASLQCHYSQIRIRFLTSQSEC